MNVKLKISKVKSLLREKNNLECGRYLKNSDWIIEKNPTLL